MDTRGVQLVGPRNVPVRSDFKIHILRADIFRFDLPATDNSRKLLSTGFSGACTVLFRHMETVVNVDEGDPVEMSAMLAMVHKKPHGDLGEMHDPRILLLGDACTRSTKIFTRSIELPIDPESIGLVPLTYKGNAYISTKLDQTVTLLFRYSDLQECRRTSVGDLFIKHILVIPVIELRPDASEHHYDAMMRGTDVMRMCFFRRAPRFVSSSMISEPVLSTTIYAKKLLMHPVEKY